MTTDRPTTTEQKWLFVTGTALILLAIYFFNKNGSVLAGSALFLGTALIIIGAVNPDTIQNLGWKRGKEGGEFGLSRHIPSAQEKQEILNIADDEQSASIAEEPLVKTAEERDPNLKSATDYLLLATNAWKEKNYDDGLQYAYEGLSLHPDDKRIKATLEHRIGALFADLDLNDYAMRHFKKAIGTDPGFSWPHNGLGILLDEQGHPDEAEEAYRNALILDPKLVMAHNNLGVLLTESDRLEDAEAAYHKAIDLDPEFAAAHNNLGILLKKLGRLEEAGQHFEKAESLEQE